MNAHKFTEEMKSIQDNLLRFIEDNNNLEEKLQSLNNIFDEINICNDKNKIKSLLHLISQISDNHHVLNFFNKIEKVLILIKDVITKNFTNRQIFDIFKNNKRILLFLIEEKILTFNEYIFKQITTKEKYFRYKYPQYFAPEIKQFLNKNDIKQSFIEDINKELPETFYENRKDGKNDEPICRLIQKDMIDDFIVYVNQNNLPLDSTINSSIYETNSFLLEKQANSEKVTLIEYSIFFASIQIFKYLHLNKVNLTPQLWLYAIHGKNPEILHIIEENKIEPKSYKECLNEAIRCHHNDIANYFLNNNLEEHYDIETSLKYHNFNFIDINDIKDSILYELCKYDYYYYVDFLMKSEDFDINMTFGDYDTNKTSLFAAVAKNNIEIVNLLLQDDQIDVNFGYEKSVNDVDSTDKNEDIADPWVNKAAQMKRLEQQDIIDKTIELIKYPIYKAIEKENIEIIKMLVNDKRTLINKGYKSSKTLEFNVNRDGPLIKSEDESKTPICLAIEMENIEIIQILLQNKQIDLNFCYSKSIEWKASDYYRGDIWNEEKNMHIERNALTLAVEKENIEIIQLLMTNDEIDVNFKCKKSRYYHFLIDAWNCDFFSSPFYEETIDEKDEKTALIIAIENKNSQIAQLLLKKNIKIDNIQCVRYLSWVKEPIGEKNKKCEYAEISKEAEEENEKMVGRINEETQKDMTALDVANEIGDFKIINLLNEFKNH